MALAQQFGRERPHDIQEKASSTRRPLDPYDQYVSASREEALSHQAQSTHQHDTEGETPRQRVDTRSRDQFLEQEPDTTPRRSQVYHRAQYDDLESTLRQSTRAVSRGKCQEYGSDTPPRRRHHTQYQDDDRESTPRATSRVRSPEQELTPRCRLEDGFRHVISQRDASPTRPVGESVRYTQQERDPNPRPERRVHFRRGNQPPRRRVNERDAMHRESPENENDDSFSDRDGSAGSHSRGYDRSSERERRVPGAYPQTPPRDTRNVRDQQSDRYRAAEPLRRPRAQDYIPPTCESVEDESDWPRTTVV